MTPLILLGLASGTQVGNEIEDIDVTFENQKFYGMTLDAYGANREAAGEYGMFAIPMRFRFLMLSSDDELADYEKEQIAQSILLGTVNMNIGMAKYIYDDRHSDSFKPPLGLHRELDIMSAKLISKELDADLLIDFLKKSTEAPSYARARLHALHIPSVVQRLPSQYLSNFLALTTMHTTILPSLTVIKELANHFLGSNDQTAMEYLSKVRQRWKLVKFKSKPLPSGVAPSAELTASMRIDLLFPVHSLLMSHLIHVNQRDTDGNTLLMLACKKGKINLISLFLQVPGVDLNAKNKDGLTAYELAMQFASPSVMDLLRSYTFIEPPYFNGDITDRYSVVKT